MAVSTAATATVDARARQRRGALKLANAARSNRAALKRDMRSGRLTLPEVARLRPDALRDLTLLAIVSELPGIRQRRLEELNRRAIRDRVNLARTLGDAAVHTLAWLVWEVTDVKFYEPPDAGHDDGWRSVALELNALICEHERSVCDESLPAERWAWADERLHAARARVMAETSDRLDPTSGETP